MQNRGKGQSFVVGPDAGESYWQPVPANGYADVRVSARNQAGNSRFSTGVQVIAPHSHIREHSHDAHEELLFFFEGIQFEGVERTADPRAIDDPLRSDRDTSQPDSRHEEPLYLP